MQQPAKHNQARPNSCLSGPLWGKNGICVISQKSFIVHMYVTPLQKEILNVIFLYITFSINFNAGSLGGTQLSKRYSTSFHVAWSMFGFTVATASLMGAFRC
jgi:hypothetical protein